MKRKASRKPRANRAKRSLKSLRKNRASVTAKRADAIDALVTASAQALGLTLDPAWHDSVAFNLRLILRHAALVDEFALPDDAEPAPVFHA
jgi:1-carboxybiuret hydrolase subunit AtzG-like protein